MNDSDYVEEQKRAKSTSAWFVFLANRVVVDFAKAIELLWMREYRELGELFFDAIDSLSWSPLAVQVIHDLHRNKELPPPDCNVEQDFEQLGLIMYPPDEPEPKPDKGHGFIYFAYLPTQDIYKVGKSKNPQKRIKSILGSSPIDDTPIMYHVLETDDMDYAEKEFHHYYAAYRVTGEWFKLPAHVTGTIKGIKRWQVVKNPELPLKVVA